MKHELPKFLRVTVTRDHINRGARCDDRNCPIALAVKPRLPEGSYPAVSDGHVRFVDGINNIYYECSAAACEFITNFDNGRRVKPTTFVFRRIR